MSRRFGNPISMPVRLVRYDFSPDLLEKISLAASTLRSTKLFLRAQLPILRDALDASRLRLVEERLSPCLRFAYEQLVEVLDDITFTIRDIDHYRSILHASKENTGVEISVDSDSDSDR